MYKQEDSLAREDQLRDKFNEFDVKEMFGLSNEIFLFSKQFHLIFKAEKTC